MLHLAVLFPVSKLFGRSVIRGFGETCRGTEGFIWMLKCLGRKDYVGYVGNMEKIWLIRAMGREIEQRYYSAGQA